MKNYIMLLPLISFVALQSMEKREDAKPYAKREGVGKVSRIVDMTYRSFTHTAEDIIRFYIGSALPDGSYRQLRRFPRSVIGLDAEVTNIITQIILAFNTCTGVGRSPKRLVPFKDLFTNPPLNGYFDFRNKDVALPLFLHPDVEMELSDGALMCSQGDAMPFQWRTAGAAYGLCSTRKTIKKFFVHATPLQFAAMSADWEAMEWLLENGANPQATTDDLKETPLQLLINLAKWEQRGSRNEESNQNEAAKFVTDEWHKIMAKSTYKPTLRDRSMRWNMFSSKQVLGALFLAVLAYILLQMQASK